MFNRKNIILHLNYIKYKTIININPIWKLVW